SLVRADVFVLTKTNSLEGSTQLLCEQLRAINSRALIVQSEHKPRCFRDIFTDKIVDLKSLANQKVMSFCAIGDPSSLEEILQQTGVELAVNFIFADHHIYTQEDIKNLIDYANKENINILVTTHKDAVKITAFKSMFQEFTVLS